MSVIPGTRIINSALELLQVTQQGETPAAAETASALLMLNAMWANWNGDDLTQLPINTGGTWAGGVASDFLGGPSGGVAFPSYLGPGPSRVRNALTSIGGSRNVQLTIRNLKWYRELAFPALSATGISDFVYQAPVDSASGGTVYVYPVPSVPVTIAVTFLLAFPIAADATTPLLPFPQMAVQASIFNLAVNYGNAFGATVPATVLKEAQDSLARLRNYNASQFDQDPNPPQGQALQPPAQAAP